MFSGKEREEKKKENEKRGKERAEPQGKENCLSISDRPGLNRSFCNIRTVLMGNSI